MIIVLRRNYRDERPLCFRERKVVWEGGWRVHPLLFSLAVSSRGARENGELPAGTKGFRYCFLFFLPRAVCRINEIQRGQPPLKLPPVLPSCCASRERRVPSARLQPLRTLDIAIMHSAFNYWQFNSPFAARFRAGKLGRKYFAAPCPCASIFFSPPPPGLFCFSGTRWL